jgi:DNA-binding IclR family transcriptional regulator
VPETSSNSVQKTFTVLSTITTYGGGASLTELSSMLGYPLSTLHRLLRELMSANFVVQDPMTKLYWVGPEISRIAHARPQDDLLRAVARPALHRLSRDSGETVFISVREGFQLLSVDCVLSGRRLLTWGEPGSLGPLHATSQGKMILACLPEELRQRTVKDLPLDRYTPFTLTGTDELLQELRTIAERRYAVNNQEHDEGTVSIAVPLRSDPSSDEVTTAISIGAPMNRLPLGELIDRHLDQLFTAAEAIQTRMTEVLKRR